MSTAALLEWLTLGHSSSLRILEQRITSLMGELREARTPAQRAEVEGRLRPLVVRRRELLAGKREAA